MWTSMSLVMMFPMAAPMLSVYLDIAEIAEQKGNPAVHCGVLAAGFLLVWLGFGTAMTVVQIAGSLLAAAPPSGPFAAAALLLLAGAYQFSPFRNECLVKCKNPMLYFLANWSDRTVSVLKMGSAQGLNCLGCCWAIMSLALIGGLMNVFWMALAALLLITERVMGSPRSVSYGIGAGLLLAGLSIVLSTQVQFDADY
jgi:predicted metal-binding membrane protein